MPADPHSRLLPPDTPLRIRRSVCPCLSRSVPHHSFMRTDHECLTTFLLSFDVVQALIITNMSVCHKFIYFRIFQISEFMSPNCDAEAGFLTNPTSLVMTTMFYGCRPGLIFQRDRIADAAVQIQLPIYFTFRATNGRDAEARILSISLRISRTRRYSGCPVSMLVTTL